ISWVFRLFFLFPTVHSAEKLEQKVLMTKAAAKLAIIECTDSSYLHWYQQKNDEALKRILYFSRDGGTVPDGNHPEKDDFTVTKDYDLKINSLKKSHSAVYYCASWDGAQ
uniref:Immunoglobulin V-set domain-containing protein n=1 Tax=Pygocentrus nattereri TaxID=42514 RepID=A0AAR2ITS5_PYGNA